MEQAGKVSEWNEATLKVIRLHDIQSTINILKMDPLTRNNGKFNYEWLAKAVDSLYGEGYSKYTEKERTKVDRIRKLMLDILKYTPPHKQILIEGHSKQKKSYVLNNNSFERLMEIVEMFERIVKDYNDDHGLTTKNRDTGGLF